MKWGEKTYQCGEKIHRPGIGIEGDWCSVEWFLNWGHQPWAAGFCEECVFYTTLENL